MTPKDEFEDTDGVLEESQSSVDPEGHVQEEALAPVKKRKGGRKPHKIYATAEERKQRNRQAQAEFRERRTEYIKQLEISIKENESKIEEMQKSHNSVNVQSELQAVSSRSNTRSQDNVRMMRQAPNDQRDPVRKALRSLAPKLDTYSSIDQPLDPPQIDAALSSTTHAVSPVTSVSILPTRHQHVIFHNSAGALQQQPSPHVSPYSDGQGQFLGYASSQLW
ncbi:MAG: hypothetical protein M1828_002982 [Chrysothrix sp. TS-e1954]|nr:MAG: hypothetical protein M1828_002982 [Chrysothrix sp. TS-e1954]